MMNNNKLFLIIPIIFFLLFYVIVSQAGVIADGQIVVSGTAQSISGVPADAKTALITVEGDSCRIYFKSTPTGEAGHLRGDGDSIQLDNYHDIKSFKVILDTGTSGVTVDYSISN